jgi:uncharacterized protein YhfF
MIHRPPHVPAEFESFWAGAERLHAELDRGRFLEAFAFGADERTADTLADLVISGAKRATASLLWTYEFEKKPVPRPGDLSIVTTWGRTPLCIIETTAADVIAFEAVAEGFAAAEGEGDRTLETWRANHTEFFAGECARIGRTLGPRAPVVCEHFRVVFQP